jgi:2-keto-3-deoxy-L-rhamnonate aldolase RhmA
MNLDFRRRLLSGETLRGVLLNLPSAAVAEILAGAGFDWLFIDAENGAIDARELVGILQAVERDLACIVRVPALGSVAIKRALEMGAAGIIVPHVDTAAQTAEAVRLARYAPAGERGMGLARANRYGFALNEYITQANDAIAVIVQAEHFRAVENIDQIAAVPGLDAIFLGPLDLSASLGHPGKLDHPRVVEAIDHITQRCQAAGMPLGFFGVDARAVKPFMARGYTLICAGVDCLLLGQGARRLADELKS